MAWMTVFVVLMYYNWLCFLFVFFVFWVFFFYQRNINPQTWPRGDILTHLSQMIDGFL